MFSMIRDRRIKKGKIETVPAVLRESKLNRKSVRNVQHRKEKQNFHMNKNV